MGKIECTKRILFNKHMIEFGKKQCFLTNWTESLGNIAGDTFRNNTFMNMMSKSMYLTSLRSDKEQFNIKYQGYVTISKKKIN